MGDAINALKHRSFRCAFQSITRKISV